MSMRGNASLSARKWRSDVPTPLFAPCAKSFTTCIDNFYECTSAVHASVLLGDNFGANAPSNSMTYRTGSSRAALKVCPNTAGA